MIRVAGTAFSGGLLVAGTFWLLGVGVPLALFIGAAAGLLCAYGARMFDGVER